MKERNPQKKKMPAHTTTLGKAISNHPILSISMGIMLLFALFIGIATLFFGAIPYIIILICSYALLQDKIQSESLRRIVILLNIVGTGSALFFFWAGINFVNNYTF